MELKTMTYTLILTITTLLLGFCLSFAGFYIYKEKAKTVLSSVLKKELAFAPIYISAAIMLTLLYFITPLSDDFIHDFGAGELFVPLFLTGICYLISLFPSSAKFLNLAIILSVSGAVFLLPTDFLLFKGHLPFWADRLALIVLWSIFSCFYGIFNGIDGILPIQSLSYLLTLMILAVLGAAPLFLGLAALSLLTATCSFLSYNWFPSKINLSDNSCKIFGYLLGSLMVLGCSENLAPCFAIVLTIFALELVQSLCKKLSGRERYKKLNTNTICYQAHIKGLNPEQVCLSFFKIEILFIMLGCFQAYLPNNYSLPIASLFLAAWFLNKLKHWDDPELSLKEINQEFMSDLRQNIKNIKNTINRD